MALLVTWRTGGGSAMRYIGQHHLAMHLALLSEAGTVDLHLGEAASARTSCCLRHGRSRPQEHLDGPDQIMLAQHRPALRRRGLAPMQTP
jgi:hypothetical protein